MTEKKKWLKTTCENLLKSNIIPFWTTQMIDQKNGGFYGRIDGRNRVHETAPKGIILNSRILWTFSAIYRYNGDDSCAKIAHLAYEYIKQKFIDEMHGGVYWMLDEKGNILESKKQVYAQAFTIYACAEYHAAFGNIEALDLAKDLYAITEKYSFDSDQNGYLEAFDQEWNLLDDLRLSDKDANEAKTMNTHLHVLEAYTNLYRYWRDAGLKKQLKNLVELFLEKFVDESGHFHLFFDENWMLKSEEFSYGHDIEGGWLLHEAAEVLEDEHLIEKTKKAALMMTEAALEGMDDDGGLMNDGSKSGVEDTDKHWWPQAEALVGLTNSYQISGDQKYLFLAEKNMNFILSNIIDESGEWHWMVDKNGITNYDEDKAGPWKCPYHNGRAMLELIERLK